MTRATKLFLVYVATIIVTVVASFLMVGSGIVEGLSANSTSSESQGEYSSEPVPEEAETNDEAETEDSEESVSSEAEDALDEAQSFVDSGPTSRVTLMDMLGTDYGVGYSDEAVEYAVDNVNTDWGDNATGTAEIFLEGNPEASADEVFNFLVDPELNGFTDGEADQAVGHLGLLS